MASKRIFDIIFRTKGTDKAASAVKGLGSAIGTLTKTTALAGAGIAAVSVKLAGDFSKNLREVSTLMGNTTERQIKAMSKELRLLSQTSGLALSSLSKAKYDVVSAGFTDAADSARILAETTRLAVGGVTSAAAAADILTTALNAYGLEANQVNDVSDTLFTTVRLGKTTMDELGASLGAVLPVAKSAGISFSTVGAAMASLTAGGINTAQSTTALRGAIIALSAPTNVAAKEMEKAGIEAKKFEDGGFDLLETIKQFEGMDPATLRRFIPDIRASVAISALANNVEGLSDNLLAFESRTGATEEAFGKMAGEFNTQMAMMKNSAQSIMIEIGNVIIEAILPSIETANEALQKLGAIGFDEVAKRLADNFGVIKQIASLGANVIFDEMRILALKGQNMLPWWLGGKDEDIADAIKFQEQAVKANIQAIKILVDSVIADVTKPPPVADESEWSDWQEGMDKMFADMDFGDIWTTPEEDLPDKVDDYSDSLIRARIAAEELKIAEEKKKQTTIDSLQETAKAAALNADSAEDAMERIVRAAFMEAVAKQIAKIIAKVPFPFNLVAAAGVGTAMTGLFDKGMSALKNLKFAQFGMDEMVSQPTLIMAGEAGPERVQVTPATRPSVNESNGGMTINFLGPVTDRDFVRDTIIPEIEKTQRLGLA